MKRLGASLLAAAVLVATMPAAEAAVFISADGGQPSTDVQTALDGLIDRALLQLKESSDRFNNILDAISGSIQDRTTDFIRLREDPTGKYTAQVNGAFVTILTYSNGSKFSREASASEVQNYSKTLGLETPITLPPIVAPSPVAPPVAAVPEPAMWAMMLVGFGLVGGMMRRRKGRITTRVAFNV